jgi:hypothetical protein
MLPTEPDLPEFLTSQFVEDAHRRKLLYIRPKNMPTEEPVIDDLTLRMVGALRSARSPSYGYCGLHSCVRGALSDSSDRILPNGWMTNTLCVHYLAYHRTELPEKDRDAVGTLPPDKQAPTSFDLHGPELYNSDNTRVDRPIDAQRDRYERPK